MAKFPTYEEMAKNIAEKALDEFLYDGKSIREWMQIIASEDCISRQAVRKILVEAKELGSWNDSSQINRLDAIDNVDMLPSATLQEPRKGEWKHGKELSKEYRGRILVDVTYEDWHCSNCHCVIKQSIKPKWNYCPNCGCRMVEP